MSSPLRVAVLGLGPIGRAVCREIAVAGDMELVGAVDPAPGIAGEDLGKLTGEAALRGIKVCASLDALTGAAPHAVAHLATSRFSVGRAHLADLVKR
jgi:hypothetical protein